MEAEFAKQKKIPTDKSGKDLKFTGEENFSEFKIDFFRYCADNDLSDITDPEYLISAPSKPIQIINKMASGEDLSEAEDRRLTAWRTYRSKHNVKRSDCLS